MSVDISADTFTGTSVGIPTAAADSSICISARISIGTPIDSFNGSSIDISVTIGIGDYELCACRSVCPFEEANLALPAWTTHES